MARPKLVVFDLDYTLWPFWVDTHVDAPFTKARNGKVYDAYKREVKYYPDVPDILQKLHDEGYVLALASRTSYTTEALDLVKLFGWDKLVKYWEIYPGTKLRHFEKFHSASGIAYQDMLFFDDEQRNIVDLSPKGVTCYLVQHGMSMQVLRAGLEEFAKKNQQRFSGQL